MCIRDSYGTVRGRVTDDSGAVIPDASVILTNDGTEIARTTRTNPAGDYFFTAVEPGTYTVVISAENFKKTEHNGIIVDLEQTATIDEKLAVGTAGETVEVTAAAPLIDTATASEEMCIRDRPRTSPPTLSSSSAISKVKGNTNAVSIL